MSPTTEPPSRGSPLSDLVAQTEGVQPWRRMFHAVTGGSIAMVLHRELLPHHWALLLLLGIAASLFLLDVVRLSFPMVNRAFFVLFRPLASPREAEGIASSSWYVLGVFLVTLLFQSQVAIPAILVLALADPMASVCGRLWGRRRFGKGSVEGAVVFFGTALVVLIPFVGVGRAIPVALVATLVEAIPWKVDDNLSVPLATGTVLWLLSFLPA